MEQRNLISAINNIEEICRLTGKSITNLSYCFLVGAGISFPQIPLSKDIIDHCLKKIEKTNPKFNVDSTDPMIRYSKTLEEAYPEPILRWDYFKRLVENKEISTSNLMLAHILKHNKIASIVITPNFDDFLSRALEFYNIPHVSIDHPETIKDRFDIERMDIQIIHVHGSYKFYDICNIVDEINERSESLAEILENNVFQHRSPIVIGYSGWENDGIMKGIKKMLWEDHFEKIPEKPKPLNKKRIIYWFCYDADDKENLPEWLKNHKKVLCVCPDEIKQKVREKENGGFEIEKEIDPKELTAERIFSEFIRIFDIEYPICYEKPIEHYEELVKKTYPYKKGEQFFYNYPYVYNELDTANELILKSVKKKDNQIVKFGKLVKEIKDHNEILKKLFQISSGSMNNDQFEELSNCLLSMSVPEAIRPGREFITSVNEIIDQLFSRNDHIFELPDKKVKALFVKSRVIGEFGFLEDECKICMNIFKDYGDSKDPDIQQLLKKVYQNLKSRFNYIKNPTYKLNIYHDIIRFLKSSESEEIHLCIAESYYLIGMLLIEISRYDEAINIFKQVDSLYKKFNHSVMNEWLTKSELRKGVALRNTNKIKEAHYIFDRLANRFEETKVHSETRIRKEALNEKRELAPLEKDIDSYMNLIKSDVPSRRNKIKVAKIELRRIIESYEEEERENHLFILIRFLERHKNLEDHSVREFIDLGLFIKSEILGKKDSSEKELETYKEFLKRYKESKNAVNKEKIIPVLNNMASTLIHLGRTDDELASTYSCLAKLYAREGKKEEFYNNIENACIYGWSLIKIRKDRFFKKYENDTTFNEIIKKYENETDEVEEEIPI